MHVGVVGNMEVWRVAFVGSNDEPAKPDGDVTWVITGPNGGTVVQDVDDAVSTGVYEYEHTPTAAAPYTVKASCVIDGAPQATPATLRKVIP